MQKGDFMFAWLLFMFLSCFSDKDDTSMDEITCTSYTYCCVNYCEPEGDTTYTPEEPDNCQCEASEEEMKECALVDNTCQFIE